jgi:hypothetical protein
MTEPEPDQNTDQTTDQTTEWLAASARELGLEDAVESVQGLDAAETLARSVGEHVDPAVAASTVFLLGVAAGRAADPAVAAHDFVDKLDALARSWGADTDRSPQADEQVRRG